MTKKCWGTGVLACWSLQRFLCPSIKSQLKDCSLLFLFQIETVQAFAGRFLAEAMNLGNWSFRLCDLGFLFLSQHKYKYTAMNQFAWKRHSWAVACLDPFFNGFYSGWGKTLMTHKVFCTVIMQHWELWVIELKRRFFFTTFHCSLVEFFVFCFF